MARSAERLQMPKGGGVVLRNKTGAGETGGSERRAAAEKKGGLRRILLVLDACCGYAADLDIKSLYVTDPNVPSVVVFSAPASSTYLMTSLASTA